MAVRDDLSALRAAPSMATAGADNDIAPLVAMAAGEEDVTSADDLGGEAARGCSGWPRRGRGHGTEGAATAARPRSRPEIGAFGRAAVAAAAARGVAQQHT